MHQEAAPPFWGLVSCFCRLHLEKQVWRGFVQQVVPSPGMHHGSLDVVVILSKPPDRAGCGRKGSLVFLICNLFLLNFSLSKELPRPPLLTGWWLIIHPKLLEKAKSGSLCVDDVANSSDQGVLTFEISIRAGPTQHSGGICNSQPSSCVNCSIMSTKHKLPRLLIFFFCDRRRKKGNVERLRAREKNE